MSSLANRVSRIFGSNVTGRLLALVVVVGLLGSIALYLYPRSSGAVRLDEIPHPQLDEVDDPVRQQAEDVRQRLERALKSPEARTPLLQGRAYGEMGRVYQVYQFHEAAGVCYRNAQRLQPDEYRWSYLLAIQLEAQGKVEESVREYQRALRLMRVDLSVTGDQGVAVLCRVGDAHLSLGQHERARAAWLQALADNPESAYAHARLGQLAIQESDLEGARKHLEEASRLAPAAAAIDQQLASVYGRLGEKEKAAAALAKGRRSSVRELPLPDPILAELNDLNQSSTGIARLGLQSLKAGRWRVAVSQLEEALRIDPESVAARVNLSIALMRRGRHDDSAKQLEEALRRSPNSLEARFNLGEVLFDQGRYKDALTHYRISVAADPSRPIHHFAVAACLSRTGEFGGALESFSKAVDADPAHVPSRIGQARMLAALGRYSDSIASLEESLKLMPNHGAMSDPLSRLLAASPPAGLRDGPRALALAEKAWAAGESITRAETLAMALAEVGRFDEAIVRQQWAIGRAGEVKRDDQLPRLRRNLAQYRVRKPCRTPWAASELFPAG